MTITIRRATQQDDAAIKAIIRAANINPLGLNWRRFLVAEEEGEIIGTGQIKPHSDGSHEMASIAVIPARQKQGIARQIIEALLAEAPPTLYLMCRNTLEAFYTPFGFRRIARAEMPPYFRRIHRAAQFFASPLNLILRKEISLLVMKREG